jgi:hypothetical protein
MVAAVPSDAVVRSSVTLESCVFTVGDFCPVESLGFSLIGSLFLAFVLGSIGLAITLFKSRERRAKLLESAPRILAAARIAISEGDVEKADSLLAPLALAGSKRAKELLRDVAAFAEKRIAAFAAVRDGDIDAGFQLLAPLVEAGDADAQYLLGLICLKAEKEPGYRLHGLRWLAVAASRGNAAATKEIESRAQSITAEEQDEMRGFAEAWMALFKERRAAA